LKAGRSAELPRRRSGPHLSSPCAACRCRGPCTDHPVRLTERAGACRTAAEPTGLLFRAVTRWLRRDAGPQKGGSPCERPARSRRHRHAISVSVNGCRSVTPRVAEPVSSSRVVRPFRIYPYARGPTPRHHPSFGQRGWACSAGALPLMAPPERGWNWLIAQLDEVVHDRVPAAQDAG
jgi:hypothetical protein